MVPGDAGGGKPVDELLAERPLSAYLGGEERLFHVLTNRRVGVERTDETTTQIRPAEDCGAVAGLTDRRILLLVGDPADHDGDFAASLPYADVRDATAATELLTASLRFETVAGATWSFTAREADVDDVETFLTDACAGWGDVTKALDELDEHCWALADALDAADWATFDERRSAAEAALETAREGADDVPIDGVVERTERLETDCYRLVRDRYVRRGEELLSEAERLLGEEEFEASRDRVETARDRFQDATDAATAHGVDDRPAQEGLSAADDFAATLAARPLASARGLHDEAISLRDSADRAAALEDALDAYREVARLVTAADARFDGDEGTVRDETEAVIDDLVTARLTLARERRAAGDWEWQADNEEAAYDLLSAAREDFDRALSLAEQFPPGDALAIERERDALVENFDPLKIRYELAKANAELRE
ncbi:hypothetical protein KTS45_12960 [Halomicroarcula limicola]|uniref:YokE-like PH domain-containing protein n=1 Tax=Haloarcula limicola TaxID=1429915 RepID=A0A8J8C494_9EURY|nr:hypothetical protein [Halomicroarcula limicola]MBV0925107.1 hypothetical protein [Halomicroarcula limicola]